MKKILFGLIATVMLSFAGNAQDKASIEKSRVKLATSMSMLVEDCQPSFKKGMSYNDFLSDVVLGGVKNSTLKTASANNLYKKAYSYLSNGTSSSEIIAKDKGTEVADVLYLINKSSSLEDGAVEVFGNDYARIKWPPRWLSWIWDNRDEIIEIICFFANWC
jgi:hypothetical protein